MTFLEKYNVLKKSIPVQSVHCPDTVNCEYIERVYKSKNCYYCVDGYGLEDCIYADLAVWNNKIADCSSVTASEKCYQCIDSNKCHSCTYLMDCNSCTDCHFSSFLNSCTDCFGCVALTHKKYCIFNKQYTKEEYFREVAELKKESPEKTLNRMLELKKTIPHPASQQTNNENCPYGDYIYDSKNCYWCFNTFYNQDSGYTYYSSRENKCWDTYCAGGTPDAEIISERCYEMVDCTNNYECAFLYKCDNNRNCYYSSSLRNCSDCFGCVGLTNKKYCVLNNQVTKEQYEKALIEIKKELGWKV